MTYYTKNRHFFVKHISRDLTLIVSAPGSKYVSIKCCTNLQANQFFSEDLIISETDFNMAYNHTEAVLKVLKQK